MTVVKASIVRRAAREAGCPIAILDLDLPGSTGAVQFVAFTTLAMFELLAQVGITGSDDQIPLLDFSRSTELWLALVHSPPNPKWAPSVPKN